MGVGIALVASWGLTTSHASWTRGFHYGVAWQSILVIVALAVVAALVAAVLPARATRPTSARLAPSASPTEQARVPKHSGHMHDRLGVLRRRPSIHVAPPPPNPEPGRPELSSGLTMFAELLGCGLTADGVGEVLSEPASMSSAGTSPRECPGTRSARR